MGILEDIGKGNSSMIVIESTKEEVLIEVLIWNLIDINNCTKKLKDNNDMDYFNSMLLRLEKNHNNLLDLFDFKKVETINQMLIKKLQQDKDRI